MTPRYRTQFVGKLVHEEFPDVGIPDDGLDSSALVRGEGRERSVLLTDAVTGGVLTPGWAGPLRAFGGVAPRCRDVHPQLRDRQHREAPGPGGRGGGDPSDRG